MYVCMYVHIYVCMVSSECLVSVQGRNLLCIHSKKHIKNPPEDMARKSAQNLESMKVMVSIKDYFEAAARDERLIIM